MADWYNYVRLKEDGSMESAKTNDYDGSITGHIVMGVKEWFDENPEERKRLGWIKYIHPDKKLVGYDPQTEYLVKTVRQIDEYTIQDEWHALPKSEEMLLLEDMLDSLGVWTDRDDNTVTTIGHFHFIGDNGQDIDVEA